MAVTDEALRIAARSGLGLPPQRPVELVASQIASIRYDRLSGFAVEAIRSGALDSTPEVYERLVAVWHGELVGATLVEALAVRTARRLDDAGVRWRLTKGAAVAHLDYPEQLASRTFGDVDLVVHQEDWYRSLEVLSATGHTRPAPELRPGWDRRFGKGATMTDADGFELDLHLRFAVGRFGVLAQMDELFARRDTIELAGRLMPTLAGSDRLLHACHHLVLGGFSKLRAARDVVQLLLVTGVDWERTVATAERWRVEAVVASGVTQAWDRLKLPVDHGAHRWAVACRIGARDARAIAVFTAERPFRDQALTAVGAIPVRSVPGYLKMLTFPTADARGGRSALEHVRSRLRALARRPFR